MYKSKRFRFLNNEFHVGVLEQNMNAGGLSETTFLGMGLDSVSPLVSSVPDTSQHLP